MVTHEHACLHCDAKAMSEAPFSPQLVLPEGWRWWTRRGQGMNAAVCCPSCWNTRIAERTMRRIGGPIGRAARGGTRG
jgi:hypothetical protein